MPFTFPPYVTLYVLIKKGVHRDLYKEDFGFKENKGKIKLVLDKDI